MDNRNVVVCDNGTGVFSLFSLSNWCCLSLDSMIEELHLKIEQLSIKIDFIKVLIPEMLLNILEKMGINEL